MIEKQNKKKKITYVWDQRGDMKNRDAPLKWQCISNITCTMNDHVQRIRNDVSVNYKNWMRMWSQKSDHGHKKTFHTHVDLGWLCYKKNNTHKE